MKYLVEDFNETSSTLKTFETDMEFSTQPSSGQTFTSIGLISETLVTETAITTTTMLNSSIQALPELTTAAANTVHSVNSSILINLVGRLTNCSYLNADLINNVKIRVSLIFFLIFVNIFFKIFYLKIFKLESLYKSVANFKNIEVTNVISNE